MRQRGEPGVSRLFKELNDDLYENLAKTVGIDKAKLKEAKIFEQITLKPNGLTGNSIADNLLVWKEYNSATKSYELKGICIDAKIRSGEPYEQFIDGAPYQPNQKAMIERGVYSYEVRTVESKKAFNDNSFSLEQGDIIEIVNFVKVSGDVNPSGIPGVLKEF